MSWFIGPGQSLNVTHMILESKASQMFKVTDYIQARSDSDSKTDQHAQTRVEPNSEHPKPEVSVSTLSFTLTNQLLQLIDQAKHETYQPNEARSRKNRSDIKQAIKSNISQAAEGFVISKLRLADIDYANRRRISSQIRQIEIMCVANVLHLTMSDSIKIKVSSAPQAYKQRKPSDDKDSRVLIQSVRLSKNLSHPQLALAADILLILTTLSTLSNRAFALGTFGSMRISNA